MRLFYYFLAEKLGYVSVSAMLREVTSQEISEWQVYYKIQNQENKNALVAQNAKARAKQTNR